MKRCPRCAAEIYSSMKKCPRCGLPVSEMQFSDEEMAEEEPKKLTKNERKALNKKKKEQRKQEKREQRLRESRSDTDFSQFATNHVPNENEDQPQDVNELLKKTKKKNKADLPQFQLDENGEFNIDTSDVEVVGEEGGKIIEERFGGNSYSVKKERGDYRPQRIKWWELYKLADRSFARRKIKKEVNKAAKIKPDFIKKWKLLLLAIFFGWMGAHNFYAKNYKKGWVSLIFIVLSMSIISLGDTVEFFAKIRLSIGGFTGFVVMFIWLTDVFAIIFNSFKYRIQKEEFIFNMNIETRAKLGEKYIDIELYKKPWWVRMKAWFVRKKRDYEEWKHDRRQAMIDKEKRKLERAQQQEEESKKKAEEDAEQNELLKELRAYQSEGDNVEAAQQTEKGSKKKRKSSKAQQENKDNQPSDASEAPNAESNAKSEDASSKAETPANDVATPEAKAPATKKTSGAKPKAKLTTKKGKKK